MTDSLKQIICPACGTEMQKIFIAEKSLNIDICSNGCGGMYFDNQEIQEFNNSDEGLDEIKKLYESKNFFPVDESAIRTCPACGTPMAKTLANGIQIDTCYNCGGIFLDKGEFNVVRQHFKKRPPKAVNHLKDYNNTGIELEKFYREAQLENNRDEMLFRDVRRFRRRKINGIFSLLYFLLR